jgi:hypothetical protein
VEVEAIGKVRHKNLVGLVGYCAEGAQRYFLCAHMTVSSYFEMTIPFFFPSNVSVGTSNGHSGCLCMSTLTMAIWSNGCMVMSAHLAL